MSRGRYAESEGWCGRLAKFGALEHTMPSKLLGARSVGGPKLLKVTSKARDMLALCSVTALLGLLGRSPPPRMGGFEQRRGSTTALGQARVGLLVRGSTAVCEQLQNVCCGQASSDAPGIRGVIYRLTNDSAEVVAEGEREALVKLASSVVDLSAKAAGAALCRKQGLYCRPSG